MSDDIEEKKPKSSTAELTSRCSNLHCEASNNYLGGQWKDVQKL